MQAPISAARNAAQSPLNQHIPSSIREDRRGGGVNQQHRDKNFLHKLSFNRAVSEPPSANKNNAVMPVKEGDYDDEQSSQEMNRGGHNLERVEEEERKSNRVGGDGGPRPNGPQHDPPKQVPPLMIGQVHQMMM